MTDTAVTTGTEPNASTQDGKTTSEPTSVAGDTFTPITTQDELNKLIGKTREEERRKASTKFADYDDVKTKAAEYDRLADANKSEIEKANERASKAEAEVAKVPALVADALRSHLVEIHKIDADKADLFLTANDPSLLLRQVQALVGTEADRKKNGNRAPREGQEPDTSGGNGERAFVRGLFNRPSE